MKAVYSDVSMLKMIDNAAASNRALLTTQEPGIKPLNVAHYVFIFTYSPNCVSCNPLYSCTCPKTIVANCCSNEKL